MNTHVLDYSSGGVEVFLARGLLHEPVVVTRSAYELGQEAVYFSRNGISKVATVEEVLGFNVPPKGALTYTYRLEIEGEHTIASFPYNFSIGDKFDILVSPNNPKHIILGREEDGALELFEYKMGSKFIAYGALIMALFVLFFGPKYFYYLLYDPSKLLKR